MWKNVVLGRSFILLVSVLQPSVPVCLFFVYTTFLVDCCTVGERSAPRVPTIRPYNALIVRLRYGGSNTGWSDDIVSSSSSNNNDHNDFFTESLLCDWLNETRTAVTWARCERYTACITIFFCPTFASLHRRLHSKPRFAGLSSSWSGEICASGHNWLERRRYYYIIW